MDVKYIFKILLLGSSGTGAKTSLLNRIVDNVFDTPPVPTIGVDFKIYNVTTNNGIVKLQIWDTAGQDRFKNIRQCYYRGCHCFILGYDITNKESFKEIKNDFYKSILENLESNPVKNPLIYLVANKIDLQDRIEVPDEEAISFANEKQIPFFKVSAKTGEGVDNLINHIINSLIKQFPYNNIKQNKNITIEEKKEKKVSIKPSKTSNKDEKKKDVSNTPLKISNKENKQKLLLLDKYYRF